MVETMASEEGQASHDQTVSLDAALKLAEGARNEEKVLGATLALRHHSELLVDAAGGRKPRQRLRAAVVDADATFICRLLQSSLPLQRLALGLLRVLLAGDDREAEEASAELGLCAKWLVEACAGAAAEVRPAAGATASKEASQERFGTEELCDTSDLLQRLLDLSAPSTEVEAGGAAVQTDARADIAKESCRLLSMLLPGGKLAALLSKEVACKSLALAESLLLRCQFLQRPPPQEAFALAESVVVAESLRGSSEQAAALGLLTAGQSQAKRQVIERWEEVIGASVGGGAPAQHALLQLVAEALPAWGLGLGAGSKSSSSPLSRLKPILVLAAGELRMGLEGYGTQEGLCAACMMLEAAIVALGKEAEALESSNLEEVSNSLRELHRAVQDIYDFLADLPRDLATPPKELPMVARVVAAFQVEDPRQFSAEFQRNLWALCLLPPSEFQVLLPCLQELQDWQATPGFGKVLETATWGLGLSLRGDPVGLDLEGLEDAQLSESPEVWRQCSLMLAEVALDAAVYLPDVSIPELSIDEAEMSLPPASCSSSSSSSAGQLARIQFGSRLIPRPVPAADPTHEGVQRLCQWSRRLWSASSRFEARSGAFAELALLCGSLLTSVPEEAASTWWPRRQLSDMWEAVCSGLVDSSAAEAATWRLSIRLAGFCLDRHQALAEALVSVARRMHRTDLLPPAGALPSHDDEDEWSLPDRSAHGALQEFVKASVEKAGGYAQIEGAALNDMD